jgi:hypothetical protein
MQIPKSAPKLFGAIRVNDAVTITLPGGKKKLGRFLGRGRFSNVFDIGPSVIIYTHHGDLSKDILSHCDLGEPNPHIPPMEYLGQVFNGTIDVYKSKWYITPVTKAIAGPLTWGYMKELHRIHDEAAGVFTGDLIKKDQCIDFNYYIAEHARVPDKLKEALICLTESAQDWGKYYLFDDFRPRNLGLDRKNNLVLLDAMFDAELMQKQRG